MTACSSPLQTGKKDAVRDFNSGIIQLETYGLQKQSNPYQDYLAKHHIKMKIVAGCIVNDKIIDHAKGYNSKMKQLVNQKLGKDIFQEARIATK